ncbi:hypothetical protein Q5H93_03350 [Hymenobacter sp. ASUV-10]|uniref:Uncharacterized protein n=1 Tax=Hymenobacter aranciens TaxID=3063996 RepID=A0ABT9B656_9BACT|nr:hypothetical protein [Hymenobacter sp. ASUV-10]MDO7873754.1 hypothetical protein [Hymenobacter sp. ASUV-10]
MPKLIDYPRTTYASAWEIAEVVDDTGGKCAIDTAARKLNRKVSGSFKAIIGSAVKFGLMTSKRELLSTTTLFKRIKHAYDKQEELLFHREAFLTPPLFTQLCRKFRSRELPVQMLDVMLIREFGVEEINAQAVARAFVEGARMVGLIDEHNIIADIDQLANQQTPRRELASPPPSLNSFRSADTGMATAAPTATAETKTTPTATSIASSVAPTRPANQARPITEISSSDAVASLFGLNNIQPTASPVPVDKSSTAPTLPIAQPSPTLVPPATAAAPTPPNRPPASSTPTYLIQISGPGVDTSLSIVDVDDLAIVQAMLEKIKRQISTI